MFTFTHVRTLLFAIVSLMVLVCVATQSSLTPAVANSSIEATPEYLPANSTFYILRSDMRRCASPMCGGYFVKQVNQSRTRCANGRTMSECYVASIDWKGASEVEIRKALVRGTLVSGGNRNGKFGVLKVSEAWQAATDNQPSGDYFRVRDLNVRCIAAPCGTHQAAKLNTTQQRTIAGVNLSIGETNTVDEALKAMTSAEGVIVVGTLADVTGPAGRSKTLNATQFYLRSSSSTSLKPCIKTGCSGQVCSDQEVITTCEYRTEYECYKKATCERQSNGNCGFTKTPELTSCLARK
jgi:uncharacterized protein DUF6748